MLCRVFCEYGFKKDTRGCDMPCICDDAVENTKTVEGIYLSFRILSIKI